MRCDINAVRTMTAPPSDSSTENDDANTDAERIDAKLAELNLALFSKRILSAPEIRSLAADLLLAAENDGHLDEA